MKGAKTGRQITAPGYRKRAVYVDKRRRPPRRHECPQAPRATLNSE